MYKILMLDDEKYVLSALKRAICAKPIFGRNDEELVIEGLDNPSLALERAMEEEYDVVMSDYRMPSMDGVAFLREFRAIQPNCVRMILSGFADMNGLVAAINEIHIFRFIAKPWQDSDLRSALVSAIEYRRISCENERMAQIIAEQQRDNMLQEMELDRIEKEYPGATRIRKDASGHLYMAGL